MAVCLKCSLTSPQPGVLCDCGKAYTVRENHGKDPLALLGKLVANKYIPITVLAVQRFTVSYEAIQASVDRNITFIVIKPEYAKNSAMLDKFHKMVDSAVNIKQQNLPTIFEVVELKNEKTVALTCDAPKGEVLSSFLQSQDPEPVSLMHIAHQTLQALAVLHQKHLLFPGFGMDNVHIMRSGGDDTFVKITGFIEANLAALNSDPSPQKDVYDMTQLVLTMITGRKPPVTDIDLPPERAFFKPIAQLFLAASSNPRAFATCVDLLNTFEAALNLSSPRDIHPAPLSSQETAAVRPSKVSHTVPLDQIIWMHQPPAIEN